MRGKWIAEAVPEGNAARRSRWIDLSTDRPSLSLGAAAYESILAEAGLSSSAGRHDDGDNHYYEAVRR
jgi:hypothetical protein